MAAGDLVEWPKISVDVAYDEGVILYPVKAPEAATLPLDRDDRLEALQGLAELAGALPHRCNPGNVWECPACWADRIKRILDGDVRPPA